MSFAGWLNFFQSVATDACLAAPAASAMFMILSTLSKRFVLMN